MAVQKEEKMRREAEERAAERRKEEEAAQAIVDEKERLTKNVRKLKTKVRQRCEELRGKGWCVSRRRGRVYLSRGRCLHYGEMV